MVLCKISPPVGRDFGGGEGSGAQLVNFSPAREPQVNCNRRPVEPVVSRALQRCMETGSVTGVMG